MRNLWGHLRGFCLVITGSRALRVWVILRQRKEGQSRQAAANRVRFGSKPRTCRRARSEVWNRPLVLLVLEQCLEVMQRFLALVALLAQDGEINRTSALIRLLLGLHRVVIAMQNVKHSPPNIQTISNGPRRGPRSISL